MKRKITLSLFVLFAAFYGMGADETLATAFKFSKAPVIDGKLNDECWKKTIEFSDFTVYGKNGMISNYPTFVKIGYDQKYLFFGLKMQEPVLEPVMNQLQLFRAKHVKNDVHGLSGDESIELFLDTSDKAGYRYIVINSLGTVFDSAGGYGAPQKWNSGIRVKTSRDTKYWYIEAAVPLKSLSAAPVSSKSKWRMNICRNRYGTKQEHSSWSPAPTGFHQPASFGVLNFSGKALSIDSMQITKKENGSMDLSAKTSGKGTACVYLTFNNGEKATFPHRFVKGDFRIRFHGLPEKKGLNSVLGGKKDHTQTVLMSKSIPVVPGKEYDFSAVIRANFTKNIPHDYNFFLLRVLPKPSKGGSYQAIPNMALSGKEKDWKRIHGTWKAPAGASRVELWIVKWAMRKIVGTLDITDITMTEKGQNENLFQNGMFNQDRLGWPVLSNLGKGYGNGCNSYQYHYSIVSPAGAVLYRSAAFRHEMSKIDSTISSTLGVRDDKKDVLPLTDFSLCTGEAEKVSLFVKSDIAQLKTVTMEVETPFFVRLLSPKGGNAITPDSISEKIIKVNGIKKRQYKLAFSSRCISGSADPGWMLVEIPMYFTTSGIYSDQKGIIRWRAAIPNKKTERWNQIPVTMLPPLAGRSPKKLPLLAWVYPGISDFTEAPESIQKSLVWKQRRAGYNNFCTSIDLYKAAGGTTFALLPTVTITGNFPGTKEFLKKHPEYAAVMANGKRASTAVSPDYLLKKGSLYREHIKEVFKDYVKNHPRHLHWDYEFPFMPGPGCQARAQIGFSEGNLALFRKEKNIPQSEKLTPQIIFKKYPKEWRDFRNRQNAEAFRLYKEILNELSPGIMFSAYSGYPPHAEEHYGVEWKEVSKYADLAIAGYGGDNAALLNRMSEKHRFVGSGILLINFFDPSSIELTLGNYLADAGAYLCFFRYIVDGKYFYKVGNAAAIAADFEKFFLNLRGNRKDHLVTFTKGQVKVIQNQDEYLAMVFNHGRAASGKLGTSLKGYAVFDHETGKRVYPNKTEIKLRAESVRAFYLIPEKKINSFVPETPVCSYVAPDPYPILRWITGSSAFCKYEVSYSRNKNMQGAVTEICRAPWSQIKTTLPPGKIYWKVRAIMLNGKVGKWSEIAECNVAQEKLLSYKAEKNKDHVFWNFTGGHGTKFDRNKLMISNKWETFAFFVLCHNGHTNHKPIKLKKGETFIVKARARTLKKNSSGYIKVELFNDKKVVMKQSNSKIFTSKDWNNLEVRIQSPGDTVADILLTARAGDVQFDNVSWQIVRTQKK